MQKKVENKAVNKAINKITDDFEKIVAVVKLKELKLYAKTHFTKLQKMKNTKSKNKTNKNWKTIWNNVLLWV